MRLTFKDTEYSSRLLARSFEALLETGDISVADDLSHTKANTITQNDTQSCQ